MHRDLAFFLHKGQVEDIHDPHHVIKGCSSHVLPAFVEELDAIGVETLGIIAEADFSEKSIPTVWVLKI